MSRAGGRVFFGRLELVDRHAAGPHALAAQHSHSREGWSAHIPGIEVLTPAILEDVRGML